MTDGKGRTGEKIQAEGGPKRACWYRRTCPLAGLPERAVEQVASYLLWISCPSAQKLCYHTVLLALGSLSPRRYADHGKRETEALRLA